MIDHEPIAARRVGRALVDHRRGPVGQRAVDDVAVAGDPTDVGRAPVHVVVGVEVEHVLVGEGDLGEVAAGRVHDALGLGGGARGVEEVQQVLRVHVLGRAVGRGVGHQLVVPVVAALDHRHVVLAPLHDDDVLDRRRLRHGGVDVRLERRDRTLPVAAVGRDDHLALGVVHPVDDRVGREPAEDHRVGRADAGAGEHGDRELRNHRHVDGDAVTALHPQRLEHVGEPAAPHRADRRR